MAAALAVAAGVAAFTLTGCGGGDDVADAPRNASREAFCKALLLDSRTQAKAVREGDWEAVAEEFHRVADSMREVGTTAKATDAERAAFEKVVQGLSEVDADGARERATTTPPLAMGLPDGDTATLAVLNSYIETTCLGF